MTRIALLAIALAGCGQDGGTPVTVGSVQRTIQRQCGYELSAQTAELDVAALVATLGLDHPTAEILSDGICANAQAPNAPVPIVVNGVVVRGAFAK